MQDSFEPVKHVLNESDEKEERSCSYSSDRGQYDRRRHSFFLSRDGRRRKSSKVVFRPSYRFRILRMLATRQVIRVSANKQFSPALARSCESTVRFAARPDFFSSSHRIAAFGRLRDRFELSGSRMELC